MMTETPELPLPPHLRVMRVRLSLEALELLELPPHKGGLLRGLLGMTLKHLCCVQRDATACPPCAMGNGCPYGYLFEPQPDPALAEGLDVSDAPSPFVVEPPEETRLIYRAGERIEFGFVLIGRGLHYLPYILLAFEELGRQGIGRRRARFRLTYTPPEPATGLGPVELAAHAAAWSGSRLTVRYLTPTRIKYHTNYVSRPEFHILVRALERRIALLALTHADERWTLAPDMFALAEHVKLVNARTTWIARDRYSPRQQQGMSLSGMIGEASYTGPLEPFRALLALGELVHVGKAATFGNGRFAINLPID